MSGLATEPMFVSIGSRGSCTFSAAWVPPPSTPMKVSSEAPLPGMGWETALSDRRVESAELQRLERMVVEARAENARLLAASRLLVASQECRGSGLRLPASSSATTREGSPHSLSGADGSAHSSSCEDGGVSVASAGEQVEDQVERTTIILQNIPSDCNRSELFAILHKLGFFGSYNFVHVPRDFKTLANCGYAYVNFSNCDAARRFRRVFKGFGGLAAASDSVCSVDYCVMHGSLDSLVKRYQNSPVMHELVPDEFKPAIFDGGCRVPFPSPTKKVKKPRYCFDRFWHDCREHVNP